MERFHTIQTPKKTQTSFCQNYFLDKDMVKTFFHRKIKKKSHFGKKKIKNTKMDESYEFYIKAESLCNLRCH